MKLALMGYARSGKDSVAEIIENEMFPVEKFAFGTELKRMFHEAFPNIPLNPKPRRGYEIFGKAMRDIDKNVWVNKVSKRVNYYEKYSPDCNFIITDLRQPNEADWCRDNGFYVIYVHAAEDLRRERSQGDSEFIAVNESESEIWMIDSDFTIYNNGSLTGLEQSVKEVLNSIRQLEEQK